MELYQLRSFVAVAEEHSITRAAKRLYTTPPSVSAHIKALEEELGVTLFERTSKGMRLTPKGDILRTKAEATLRAAQDVVNHATEMQAHLMGSLTVGANATPDFLRIPDLVLFMRDQCPGVELNVVNSSSGRTLHALKTAHLDAGYLFGPVHDESIVAHPLHTVELVVAAPSSWRDRVAGAEWEALARLPWIDTGDNCPFQAIVDDLFAQHGLDYERVAQTADETTRRTLVASGAGLSLVLREAVQQPESDSLTIVDTAPIPCRLSIAHAAKRTEDPLVQRLVDAMQRIWAVS